jgi:hypothetical protein
MMMDTYMPSSCMENGILKKIDGNLIFTGNNNWLYALSIFNSISDFHSQTYSQHY